MLPHLRGFFPRWRDCPAVEFPEGGAVSGFREVRQQLDVIAPEGGAPDLLHAVAAEPELMSL